MKYLLEGISIRCERHGNDFICRSLPPGELRTKLGLPPRPQDMEHSETVPNDNSVITRNC